MGAVIGSNGNGNELLKLSDSKGNQYNIYNNIDASLFHDCFQIARNYLENGELVILDFCKQIKAQALYILNDASPTAISCFSLRSK